MISRTIKLKKSGSTKYFLTNLFFFCLFFQPKPYSFTYGVKDEYSGTDFSRNEESHGEVIRGSYKVALPDGRVQIVS
jgi:hypothetical protein